MQNNIPLLPQEDRQGQEYRLKLIDLIITKFNVLDSGSDFFHSEISDFLNYYLSQNSIEIETLTKLLKNINSPSFAISGANIKNYQEIFLYSQEINDHDKFSAIIEICSKFPNLKLFSLHTQKLNQFYENIGLEINPGQNAEIKSFISSPQYSSITQHNGYGVNRFFLTIDNGRILTSPQKEFSEFYPIIVKEIFEKTGMLDSKALQSYIPSFEDQNQAEKFLILLYKLARANDLLTLTEAQKKQIIIFFSNIKNLTPQEISKLDEIISKEEFSLNQLEQFYKEESLDFFKNFLRDNDIAGDPNWTNNMSSNIISIIDNFDDETYKDFFQRHLNDLLGTNYDFSKANITKENSQSFLKLTLLYSQSEIEENQQFKQNLTKFLEIIATRTSIIGARNDQKTDSQKTLDAINGCALINSQNFQETSKPKFQISISSLANSANLSSANSSQNQSQNQNQIGGGVFAMRAERNLRLNEIPQLPVNFNQSPNYAHQSFLTEVLGDDNYASEFVDQAGENMNAIIHHLFFNPQNQELRDLLGDQKYSEFQNKISESPLLCIPPAPGSSENTASFQFENTYGNQGEINVGAVLDDKTLSLGIFNGVKLKLGLRINSNGSKEQGLFDDQENLLINSASVIEMYKKSGMNSDSLARTIANFRSLDSNRNGQISYIESDSTFSLRCLNGRWYLGIFQSNEDQNGQNILQFRGAIKIDNLSKIIAIPENKKVSEIASDQSMNTITNLNQWVKFSLDTTISRSSSLTNSVESPRRISSESETARLLPDKSDNEDDQTATSCCGLFSRVNKRILGEKFRDFIKPLGKIKLKEVLSLENFSKLFNVR